jgi:hypothetical protein
MTMRDRWDRLKKTVEENQVVKKTKSHISRHKVTYISNGVTLVTTVLVMKALSDGRGPSNSIDRSVGCSLAGRDINNTTINNTTNHYGTPLSYFVGVEGDELPRWVSQEAAGQALGETAVAVSRHLNHGRGLPHNPDLRLLRFGPNDRHSQN